MILNFSGLEYMNSGGIGLLVTLLVRANRQKQRLLAYGLTDHYRQIFELTRLDEAIGIYRRRGRRAGRRLRPSKGGAMTTGRIPATPRGAEHWAKPVEKLHVEATCRPERRTSSRASSSSARSRASGRCGRRPTGSGSRSWTVDAHRGRSGTGRSTSREFWPKGNQFYAPLTGIEPGEVALIRASVAGGMKLSTGVMVLYSDDEAFTLMTPQGHMFAGWITFSSHRDGEATVAQVHVLIRAQDPLSELGLALGGHRQENAFWEQTLRNLAAHLGVDGTVETQAVCVDRKRQWRKAGNIRHSVAIRNGMHALRLGRRVARARRDRRRCRAERAGGGDRPRASRALGARPRGGRDGRRRRALGRADAPGLPPRRLLGDPPARSGIAVSADAPARGARARVDRVAGRAVAHPLDDGTAAVLERSVEEPPPLRSAATRTAWPQLMGPLVRRADAIARRDPRSAAAPAPSVDAGPLRARCDPAGTAVARRRFRGRAARALFAGLAAHSMLPLTRPPSAAFGLVLALLGHAVGWPMARGGSQAIADALAAYLRSLGGEIETGRRVESLDELPPARAVLFDVTPRQLLAASRATRLPARYRRRLGGLPLRPGRLQARLRARRPDSRGGPRSAGGRRPSTSAARWRRSPRPRRRCRGASTPERPFVLVAQQSLFDPTRAPAGKHTAWAYCHVPNGSTVDMTDRIEAQIERFAPGFRELVLARHAMGPAEMEAYNPNYVGGDINGGVQDLRQLFTRPVARLVPYATPVQGALPLLVVDAARRRRPRHVRLLRRAGGAAQTGFEASVMRSS